MAMRVPWDIIPMRSPRASASSMEWVVRTIERPFFMRCIISHTCLRDMGSIPVVGSSKKITEGAPTAEIATLSRRRMPPLNFPACLLATSASLTPSRRSVISVVAAVPQQPLRKRGKKRGGG